MDVVFQKTLVRAGESRSFRIDYHRSTSGWETCEEANHRVAQRQSRSDWHGVERDLARFAREIDELRQQGWREA
jgi:hypothetical protein